MFVSCRYDAPVPDFQMRLGSTHTHTQLQNNDEAIAISTARQMYLVNRSTVTTDFYVFDSL